MTYSLAAAAEAAHVNKTTILRAIKKGKVSATKDEHGEYRIDPAELHRVYPLQPTRSDAEQQAMHQHATGALPLEIAIELVKKDSDIERLKALHDYMEQQLTDLKADRDHWREQANRALIEYTASVHAPPRRGLLGWFRKAS